MGKNYAEYLAKGTTVVFISLVTSAVIGFVLRIVLARSLSTSDYGLFFAVFEFISFFAVLRHFGLNQSLTKFLPEFRERGGEDVESSIVTVVGIESISTGAVALILVVLSNWLASTYFGSSTAAPLIVVLSGFFFAMMLIQLFSSTFAGFRDMLGGQLGNLFRMVSTLGFVAFLILFLEPSLFNISTGYFLGAVLAALLSFAFLKRRHSVRLSWGSLDFDLGLGKKLFKFGLPLVLAGVAGSVMGRMDTIMITAFRSLRIVGFYQVARPAARTLGFIGGALSAPMLPMVSELWERGDRERVGTILSVMVKLSFLIVIPASMVFIAYPEVVIRILFSGQYLAGRNALRILGIGMIFQVVGAGFGPTLTGTGNPSGVLKASGSAAAFNFVANLLLVPRFGAGGAAVATTLSFLVSTGLSFLLVRRVVEFSLPVRSGAKVLSGGGAMLLVVSIFKSVLEMRPLPELFVVMVPSLVIYLVWVLGVGGVTGKDLDLLERTTPLPAGVVNMLRRLSRS